MTKRLSEIGERFVLKLQAKQLAAEIGLTIEDVLEEVNKIVEYEVLTLDDLDVLDLKVVMDSLKKLKEERDARV